MCRNGERLNAFARRSRSFSFRGPLVGRHKNVNIENILEPEDQESTFRDSREMRDHACAPSRTLIVIMVHDLSRTLNVQKHINKETPCNDSHILSFSISVFNNFSRASVHNFHHFLYSFKYLSLLSVFTARP